VPGHSRKATKLKRADSCRSKPGQKINGTRSEVFACIEQPSAFAPLRRSGFTAVLLLLQPDAVGICVTAANSLAQQQHGMIGGAASSSAGISI
jgi:hypothetical protein